MDKLLVVAYQGVPGAYSFIAAKQQFPAAKLVGCQKFSQVFDLVTKKRADYGVLPIENSTTGKITKIIDLLHKHSTSKAAELELPVNHQLLALPQVKTLRDIRFVHSHPEALEQCQTFFKSNPHLIPIPEFDTAGSAELVSKLNHPQHAAIASKQAGKLWHLKQLATNIQSNPDNFTRFIIITKNNGIQSLRQQIDRLDDELLQLLGQRLQIARQIVKTRTTIDPERETSIISRLKKIALKHKLKPEHIKTIWPQIFALSYSAAKKPVITAPTGFTVAIVGFGRFGQLLHKLLKQYVRNIQINIHTRTTPPGQISTADIVVLAVPISQIETVVKQLSPHLKPKALVIDVCTVKSHPIKIMQRSLPKSVSILATHPVWGPDSVRVNRGLEGLTIVLTPVRISRPLVSLASKLCKQLELVPLEMSAEAHDKWLAQSLLTTDLVGLVLKEMNFTSTPIDTISTKWLHKIVDEFVGNDTPQLLSDMFRFNSYTSKLLKDMTKALKTLSQQLQ